jgi:hypothetical protein
MILPMLAGGAKKDDSKTTWSTSKEKDVLYTEYWANTALGLWVSGWPDVTWLASRVHSTYRQVQANVFSL